MSKKIKKDYETPEEIREALKEAGIEEENIQEEKDRIKAKCKKAQIPYSSVELLLEEDPFSLENINFDIIKNNFYILVFFTSLKQVNKNVEWLLNNPRENYGKIMTLQEENIDMNKLFSIEFEEDEYLNEIYEEQLYLNPLNSKIIEKYKAIYCILKYMRENRNKKAKQTELTKQTEEKEIVRKKTK